MHTARRSFASSHPGVPAGGVALGAAAGAGAAEAMTWAIGKGRGHKGTAAAGGR